MIMKKLSKKSLCQTKRAYGRWVWLEKGYVVKVLKSTTILGKECFTVEKDGKHYSIIKENFE